MSAGVSADPANGARRQRLPVHPQTPEWGYVVKLKGLYLVQKVDVETVCDK